MRNGQKHSKASRENLKKKLRAYWEKAPADKHQERSRSVKLGQAQYVKRRKRERQLTLQERYGTITIN